MPPQACDAHCHVFGPGATFPYAPDRTYTPPDAPKQSLAALQSILGIERAVIVQASCHGTDNAAMLDCIASDPRRYRGVAILDASFTETDYVALHEGGIRGARFNFVEHLGGRPDMRVFHQVIQRIRPLGWHLVVHLDAAISSTSQDLIAVRGADGKRVEGVTTLIDSERTWRFAPTRPWRAGHYALMTHPELEDPAGNRICASFEAVQASRIACDGGAAASFSIAR